MQVIDYCCFQTHVLMNRGLLAMSTDQYTSAVDNFAAVLDIDPNVKQRVDDLCCVCLKNSKFSCIVEFSRGK
jgi:ABC-type uncharacterized transport system ATPase subunit